jgi:hypothetical protein
MRLRACAAVFVGAGALGVHRRRELTSFGAAECDIGQCDGQKKRLEILPGRQSTIVAGRQPGYCCFGILTPVLLSGTINGRFYGTPMASRRDSTSKRLFELFDETRLSRELAKRFFEDDILKPAGTSLDQLFDFNNDAVHAACSRVALPLNDASKAHASMLSAFKEAGLNHRNPLHWRYLLSMFAEAHFGEVKTKTKTRDSVGLIKVLNAYLTIKRENLTLNEPEIRKKLRSDKRFKDIFQKVNDDRAFRKLLGQARNPEFNLLLQHPEMEDPLVQLIRSEYEQRGTAWTPDLEIWIKGIVERFLGAVESEELSLKTGDPDPN